MTRKTREEAKAIREEARLKGVEGWDTKKLQAVESALAKLKEPQEVERKVVEEKADVKKDYELVIGDYDLEQIVNAGFKAEWLDAIANEYGFDKFAYLKKTQAFKCYKGNKHIDWIEVNDLSSLNGKGDIIRNKYLKPQLPPKPVIKLKWR